MPVHLPTGQTDDPRDLGVGIGGAEGGAVYDPLGGKGDYNPGSGDGHGQGGGGGGSPGGGYGAGVGGGGVPAYNAAAAAAAAQAVVDWLTTPVDQTNEVLQGVQWLNRGSKPGDPNNAGQENGWPFYTPNGTKKIRVLGQLTKGIAHATRRRDL